MYPVISGERGTCVRVRVSGNCEPYSANFNAKILLGCVKMLDTAKNEDISIYFPKDQRKPLYMYEWKNKNVEIVIMPVEL